MFGGQGLCQRFLYDATHFPTFFEIVHEMHYINALGEVMRIVLALTFS